MYTTPFHLFAHNYYKQLLNISCGLGMDENVTRTLKALRMENILEPLG